MSDHKLAKAYDKAMAELVEREAEIERLRAENAKLQAQNKVLQDTIDGIMKMILEGKLVANEQK